MKLFSISEVTKELLPNKVIFIHNLNTQQPIVSVNIFLKMGSIYEPQNLLGISELLQTTIIKGTKNRTAKQLAEEIELLGGGISANSDSDYSTLSIAVGKQNFEKAMEILSDIFFNPIFPEDEIEKEKTNIIADILARKDKIFNVAIDELMYNLYGGKHPYGIKPEKYIPSLKRIKRAHLLEWWKKFYAIDEIQNNIIVVISGDIDYDYAKNVFSKYFQNFNSTKLPEIANYKTSYKQKYIRKKTHFKQGYLMYGYLVPAFNKENLKDYLSLKLLNVYLGGGMSSKLFEVLREKNSLCYETNSFYPTKLLDSHFVIYLGFDYNRVQIAKKEIENIIYELSNGTCMSQKELDEAKSKIKGRFLLDHQTNLRQGWYLGFWEIMGLGCEYDKRYIEDIEKITLDDIQTVAKKIFSQKHIVVELAPKK